MKPILVYTQKEAERNSFTVEKICKGLGATLVTPDYRGEAAFVVNRSNDYEIAKYYEDRGIRVFNGAKFTRLANDKQLCYDFMQENGIEYTPCGEVGTIVYTAANGKYIGCIVISDKIKSDSKSAISS